MQRLAFIVTAALLLGSSPSFAQAVSAPGASTPPMRMSNGLATGLTNPPPPGGAGISTLGTIQGNLAFVSPFALGSVTACPVTGVATASATADADASAAAAGVVTTPAVTSPLGLSAPLNSCATTTLPVTIAPGAVSADTFSNGAVPLDDTESGQPGASPLIAVPAPGSSAACVGGGVPPVSSVPPVLFDGADAAATSSISPC
jgi:hypothetical protein